MSSRARKVFAAIALSFSAFGNAGAGPCDNFDWGQLDVAELRRCISELRSANYLYSSQIHLLEMQVCALAMHIRDIKDTTDINALIKDTCPAPKSPSTKKIPKSG